jgi:hypothetical protein
MVFVVAGDEHRRVGQGLDALEPLGSLPLRALQPSPFTLEAPPLLASLLLSQRDSSRGKPGADIQRLYPPAEADRFVVI